MTMPTLEFAKAFGRLDDITIGALLDEQDTGGPAQLVDLERLTKTTPPHSPASSSPAGRS